MAAPDNSERLLADLLRRLTAAEKALAQASDHAQKQGNVKLAATTPGIVHGSLKAAGADNGKVIELQGP